MGGDQERESWYANRDQWQAITNDREIPARRPQREFPNPIPVRVRLIWERDGAEFIDTTALGWARQLVRVQVHDRRSRSAVAWVHAEHVQRR